MLQNVARTWKNAVGKNLEMHSGLLQVHAPKCISGSDDY